MTKNNLAEYIIVCSYRQANLIDQFYEARYTLEDIREFCKLFFNDDKVNVWDYWLLAICETKSIGAVNRHGEWKELIVYDKQTFLDNRMHRA